MKTPPSPSAEDVLIRKLQQREEQAFHQLYDQYGPALFGIAIKIVRSRELAEDVLQDSFVKIWRYIDHYDPNRGRLFTWLLNITRNTAVDAWRASRTFKPVRLSDATPEQVEQPNRTSQFIPETIDVSDQVKLLRPDLQDVIDLVYFQGYSQSEAAEELGIPLGTVKTRIRAALRDLRAHFEDS